MAHLSLAFLPDPLSIPLDLILQSRKAHVGILTTRKFMQIQASIKAVGLIEPLTVGPAGKKLITVSCSTVICDCWRSERWSTPKRHA